MSELSLFPQRAPIGQFTDENKRVINIYQSPELSRAFSALFERVGGAQTISLDDVARALAASVAAPIGPSADDLDQMQVAGIEALVGQVATLAASVEELQGQVMTAASASTELGAIRQAIEDARAETGVSSAELGAIRQAIEDARLDAANLVATLQAEARQRADEAVMFGFRDPFRVDWERPGTIGSLTANTGAFTSLAASAGVTISGGLLRTLGGATFHTTTTALTNGAGAAAGTLLTAPVAGNPTKWIGIDDNGTVRYIPAW